MTELAPFTLRLILEEEPSDGVWNMALDRAIQLEHAAGRSPATVRLYRWARPTVTLGRFQSADTVDLAVCRTEGVDVVRRFTGGRGVLHDDELTYSVVAGVGDGLPRGTSASYRFLCAALVAAYEQLGVRADLTSRPRGSRSSGACYLHSTQADVSVGTLKLTGSAQVWHNDVVLQHGSFVFARDVDREARVFCLSEGEKTALAETTVVMSDLVSTRPSFDMVAQAASSAFAQLFDVRCVRAEPTPEEDATARMLAEGGTIGVLGGYEGSYYQPRVDV